MIIYLLQIVYIIVTNFNLESINLNIKQILNSNPKHIFYLYKYYSAKVKAQFIQSEYFFKLRDIFDI